MVRESNAAGTWAPGNVTTHRPRQTTKETDPDTGLRWFGARWYDPAMGSWLSPEPERLDGPNMYWAMRSGPSSGIDIDGRAARPWPINGVVCNQCDTDIQIWNDQQGWRTLKPGKCTPLIRQDWDFFIDPSGNMHKVGPKRAVCKKGPNGCVPNPGLPPLGPDAPAPPTTTPPDYTPPSMAPVTPPQLPMFPGDPIIY
jgi:RHS repeat-associated protein